MRVGDITAPQLDANGKPLDGIRILAIEQMQSLPYATQLMARMGAEVVKIEHPVRGDLGRGSTPTIADPEGRPVGGTYLRNNLSKRSVGMDLKNPKAIDLIRQMIPNFDVLAENLKPGTLDKSGLGYNDLSQVHPGLIYLSVSGFGNLGESPYGHWPAYAPIAEAMGGLYAINRAEGENVKVSPVGALGDTGTGLYGVIGVLMALRQRERHGHGQHVDIAMFDAMVAFGDMVPNYWSLGADPRVPTPIINDGFPIDSGELVMQIGREHQFERLCHLIGRPEWLEDERFSTRDGWRENLDEIRTAVRTWAGDRTTVEAANDLAAAGLAAAPVFEAPDVIDDPHVAARHMMVEIPRPDSDTPVLTPGNPVKMSAVSEGPDFRPPWLGEHTDEVLAAELGLDEAALAELRADGVIG
ncbi:MAG: CoA transferase [Acidimicrobiia bacterium]|nr:CoA transferase [Acidimicrobiia bacterium]MYB73347.1 CoA transferase [Acidimicrobiia bacterium]MYH98248.1 CoA transferase [Acidimicrobiia bacterium]